MERFYAPFFRIVDNLENPVKTGLLPTISVDNRVENVDFCIEDAVNIQCDWKNLYKWFVRE